MNEKQAVILIWGLFISETLRKRADVTEDVEEAVRLRKMAKDTLDIMKQEVLDSWNPKVPSLED